MLDWFEKGGEGPDGEDWITNIQLLAGCLDFPVYLGLAIMGAAPDKAAPKTWFASFGDAVEGSVIHGNPGRTALSILDNGCPGGRCLHADPSILSESEIDGIEVAAPVRSSLGWGKCKC